MTTTFGLSRRPAAIAVPHGEARVASVRASPNQESRPTRGSVPAMKWASGMGPGNDVCHSHEAALPDAVGPLACGLLDQPGNFGLRQALQGFEGAPAAPSSHRTTWFPGCRS